MKILFLAFILFAVSNQAISQCDKKVNWYGSKGEMYDAAGALLDTRQDSIFILTGPQKVTLKFKSDEKTLEGTVTEKTCDWKEPFKNGKTIYRANVNIDGRSSEATFTVEAKDQKITVLVQIEMMSDKKFVLYIDKYEEVK